MATTSLPEPGPSADVVPLRPADLGRAWQTRPAGLGRLLPLRLKIILPFLLLTSLLALAGSFMATRLVSGSLESRAASHLVEASTAIGASLQRIDAQQLAALRTVIHTQGVTEAIVRRDLARLGQLLAPIQLGTGIDTVEVLGPDGQELTGLHRDLATSAGSGYTVTVGRDLSGWTLTERILSGASPGDPERPTQLVEVEEGYVLYTGSPMWDGERLVGAVLVGRSWERILQAFSLDTLAQLVMLDVEGRVTGSTVGAAVTPSQLPPLGDSGQISATLVAPEPWEWQGQKYHVAYAPLQVRGEPIGTVVVILPKTETGATAEFGQDTLLILFALASIFVMGVGYLLANRITAPVKAMVQAFQRLSGGDFSPRLETQRRDEFGVLAAAFNTMTEDLELQTERLRRKILQLGMMYDTSEELSRSLELDRVLDVAADTFHASADWSFTALLLLDSGNSTYRLRRLRPLPSDPDKDVAAAKSISPDGAAQAVFRETEPAILGPEAVHPLLTEIGVGGHAGPVMAIPLRSGDPLGVVLAGAVDAEQLPSEDRTRLIATLASEAARAIQSAQRYRQVSRQVAQLVALQKASRGLASKLSLEEVLRQTADELEAIVPDSSTVIALGDSSTGKLKPEVHRGLSKRGWPARRIAKAVLKDAQPRWFDPENPSPADGRGGRGLCVPLQVESEAIGAIDVTFPEGLPSSANEEHVLLLTTIANQAAVAIKNARLHEEIQRLYLSIVQSLAAAIDARDPHTHGHSQRVVATALMVARKMGLPEDELPVLEVAAYLHDIGKLGVPDDILLKAGSLSDSERRIIDGHPDLGARILDPVGFDPRVLSCIVQHHERYDGAGYPQGRRGDEIAAGARILGAADAFDAMLSERPYRATLTLDATLEELQAGAGNQFDPSVVAAILSLVEAGELPVTNARSTHRS